MELNKKLVNFESMNENTKLTLAEALLYTKGLAGGYGGDFPLSIASKDSIYRVPATNKFYVCETAYNGNQISAPNSNFVELSVWKNHDRLNNLVEDYGNLQKKDLNLLREDRFIVYGYWSGEKPLNSPKECGLYGVIIQFNATYRTPQLIFDNNGMYYRIKSGEFGPWIRLAIVKNLYY